MITASVPGWCVAARPWAFTTPIGRDAEHLRSPPDGELGCSAARRTAAVDRSGTGGPVGGRPGAGRRSSAARATARPGRCASTGAAARPLLERQHLAEDQRRAADGDDRLDDRQQRGGLGPTRGEPGEEHTIARDGADQRDQAAARASRCGASPGPGRRAAATTRRRCRPRRCRPSAANASGSTRADAVADQDVDRVDHRRPERAGRPSGRPRRPPRRRARARRRPAPAPAPHRGGRRRPRRVSDATDHHQQRVAAEQQRHLRRVDPAERGEVEPGLRGVADRAHREPGDHDPRRRPRSRPGAAATASSTRRPARTAPAAGRRAPTPSSYASLANTASSPKADGGRRDRRAAPTGPASGPRLFTSSATSCTRSCRYPTVNGC